MLLKSLLYNMLYKTQEIIELLIDSGIDINCEDSDGHNAMIYYLRRLDVSAEVIEYF